MGYLPTNRHLHNPLEEHDAQVEHPLSSPAQPLGAIRLEDALQSEQLVVVQQPRRHLPSSSVEVGVVEM
jgi:hypothetical protein